MRNIYPNILILRSSLLKYCIIINKISSHYSFLVNLIFFLFLYLLDVHATFTLEETERKTVIRLAGKTGSSKTTIAKKLADTYPKDFCSIIQLDGMYNIDPLDSNEVSGHVMEAIDYVKTPYVIVEGALAHYLSLNNTINDFKIFIDTELDLCFEDVSIKKIKSVSENLPFVRNDGSSIRRSYREHITPQKDRADLILGNNTPIGDIDFLGIADIICEKFHTIYYHRKVPRIICPTFNAAQRKSHMSGILYMVSGPSGVGKSSIIEHVIESNSNLEKAVPYTTRPKRTNEIESYHYHFVSKERFTTLLESEEFLQHHFDNDSGYHYGILMSDILPRLDQGKSIIIDVYPNLLPVVRNKFPNVKSVFLCPPSFSALNDRVSTRDKNVDPTRFNRSIEMFETGMFRGFDYFIVNDNLLRACTELTAIILINELSLAQQQVKYATLLTRLELHNILKNLSAKKVMSTDIECWQVNTLASLNNRSVKLYDGNSTFFVRIIRENNKGYHIKPAQEEVNLACVARLGLYPNIIYYDNKCGSYVAPFLLNYQALSPQDFQIVPELNGLAVDAFIKLHQADLFSNDFSPLLYTESCLLRIRNLGHQLPYDTENIAVLYHRLYFWLDNTCLKKVPSHNDVTPYNMLYNSTDKHIVLTDWEVSGNNDPFWDLSKHSVEACLNEEQDSLVLRRYLNESHISELALARFQLYKPLIEFYLALWAKWQVYTLNDAASEEQFETMFIDRLNNCRKHIGSNVFKRNLKILIQAQPDKIRQFAHQQFETLYNESVVSSGINMSQGLIILKPDALINNCVGSILHEIEKRGYRIVGIKQRQFQNKDVEKLYPQLESQNTRYDVLDCMTSGPVVIIVVEAAKDAIDRLYILKGSTNPQQAEKGTLRSLFGTTPKWNVVHCSDNSEEAKREINLFFIPQEIFTTGFGTYGRKPNNHDKGLNLRSRL